jgi:hypothetical protein
LLCWRWGDECRGSSMGMLMPTEAKTANTKREHLLKD